LTADVGKKRIGTIQFKGKEEEDGVVGKEGDLDRFSKLV
jgi:hypothetical protein